jgi:polysaccharide export outer membrane protein
MALGGCASTPLAPNVEPLTNYTYVIGPGDTIEMFVWGNPEISRLVPVRPDGKISAPLIEELPASGKTPYQLARDIEKELVKYIRNPLVTVIVGGGSDGGNGGYTASGGTSGETNSGGAVGSGGFVGPYSEQIRVLGQVSRPQAIAYRENMSLLDLMIQVGGITQFAAGNRATITRKVNGVPQEFRVRIEDLIEDGDITANVNVLPGDILIIPEAYF